MAGFDWNQWLASSESALKLKQRQAFWETPRNLVLIIGGIVTVVGAIVGWVSYQAGRQDGRQQIIVVPPGATVTMPPAQPR